MAYKSAVLCLLIIAVLSEAIPLSSSGPYPTNGNVGGGSINFGGSNGGGSFSSGGGGFTGGGGSFSSGGKVTTYTFKTDATGRRYVVDQYGRELDPSQIPGFQQGGGGGGFSGGGGSFTVNGKVTNYTFKTDATGRRYVVDQYGRELDPSQIPGFQQGGGGGGFSGGGGSFTVNGKVTNYTFKTDATGRRYVVDQNGKELDPTKIPGFNGGGGSTTTIVYTWRTDKSGRRVLTDQHGNVVDPATLPFKVPDSNIKTVRYIYIVNKATGRRYLVDESGKEVDITKIQMGGNVNYVIVDEAGNRVDSSNLVITPPNWTGGNDVVIPDNTEVITYILKKDKITNRIYFVDQLGNEVEPSKIRYPQPRQDGGVIRIKIINETGKPLDPSTIKWSEITTPSTITYILRREKVTNRIYFVDQYGNEVDPSKLRNPQPNPNNGERIIFTFTDEFGKPVEPSTIKWTEVVPSKVITYILKRDKTTNRIYFVDQFGNEVDPKKIRFPEKDPNGQHIIITYTDESGQPVEPSIIDWSKLVPFQTVTYIVRTDKDTQRIYFVDQNGNEVDPTTVRFPPPDPTGKHIVINFVDETNKPVDPITIKWTDVVPSKTIIYILKKDIPTNKIYFVDQNGNEVDPSTLQFPKQDPNGQHIIINYVDDSGKPVEPSTIKWTEVVPTKTVIYIIRKDPETNRIYFIDQNGNKVDPSNLRFPKPDANGQHIIIEFTDESGQPVEPALIDWNNIVPSKTIVYVLKRDKPTNRIYFVDQRGYEVDPAKVQYPEPDPNGQDIIIRIIDDTGKPVEPSTIDWSKLVLTKTIVYIMKVDQPTNRIYFVDQEGNEIDPSKLQFPKPDPNGQHIIIKFIDEFDNPVEPSTIDWSNVVPSKPIVVIVKTDKPSNRIYFVDQFGHEVDPSTLQFPKPDEQGQHIIISFVDDSGKPVEPSKIDWTQLAQFRTVTYILKRDPITDRIYFVDQLGYIVDPAKVKYPQPDSNGIHTIVTFVDDSGKPVEPTTIDWENIVPTKTVIYILKRDPVTNRIYFVDQLGYEIDPSKLQFPKPVPSGEYVIITYVDESGKPVEPSTIDWSNLVPAKTIIYTLKVEKPTNKIYFVDQFGNEIDPLKLRFPKPDANGQHFIIIVNDESGKPVNPSAIDWSKLVPSKPVKYTLKIEKVTNKIYFVDEFGNEVDPATIRYPKPNPNGEHVIITVVDDNGKPVEPSTIKWTELVPSKTITYIVKRDPATTRIYFVDQFGNEVDPSKLRFPEPEPNGQHIIIKFTDDSGKPVEPSTIDWSNIVPSQTITYMLKLDKGTKKIYFVDLLGYEIDPSTVRFPKPDPSGQHIIITVVDENEKPVEPSTIDWSKLVPSRTVTYILKTDRVTKLIYFVDQKGNEVDPSKVRFPKPDPSGQHVIINFVDETGKTVKPLTIDWSKIAPSKTIIYILKKDPSSNRIYFVDQDGNKVDPSKLQFPKPDPSGQRIIITFKDETGNPVEPSAIDWTKLVPSKIVTYILKRDPRTTQIYFVDENGNEVDPSTLRFPKPDPSGQQIIINFVDEFGKPVDPSTIKWTEVRPSTTIVYILKRDKNTNRIYFVDPNGVEVDPKKIQFPKPNPSGQNVIITFVDELGQPVDPSTIKWTEVVPSQTINYIIKTDPTTNRIYFVDQQGNEIDPSKLRFPKPDPNGQHIIINFVDDSGNPVEGSVIDWNNVVPSEIITYVYRIDPSTGRKYFVDQFGKEVDYSTIRSQHQNEDGMHIIINFVDETGNPVDSGSFTWFVDLDIYTVTFTLKTDPNGRQFLVDVLGNVVDLTNFHPPTTGPNGEPITIIVVDESGNNVDPSKVFINGRYIFGGGETETPEGGIRYILKVDPTGRRYFVDIFGKEVDPSKVQLPTFDKFGNQIMIYIVDENGHNIDPSSITWTEFPSRIVTYILKVDTITRRIYFVDQNGYEVDPNRIQTPSLQNTIRIVDETGKPVNPSSIQWNNLVKFRIVNYMFKIDQSTGRNYFVDPFGKEVDPRVVFVPHPDANGVHIIASVVDESGNYIDISQIQMVQTNSAFQITLTLKIKNGQQYLYDANGNPIDLSRVRIPTQGPNGEPLAISVVDEAGNPIDPSTVHIQGLSGGRGGTWHQTGGGSWTEMGGTHGGSGGSWTEMGGTHGGSGGSWTEMGGTHSGSGGSWTEMGGNGGSWTEMGGNNGGFQLPNLFR